MDTTVTLADVDIADSTLHGLRQLEEHGLEGAISETELLPAVDRLGTD
jgi:hypothetical protein